MENMGSQKSNPIRKPMRRRSHTRRLPPDCIINMAEARREIVQALHLHRSSSSTRKTTAEAVAAAAAPNMLGNSRNYCTNSQPKIASSSSQCCYYSLTESMPLPEPIWSTTAPTIPAAPPASMESLEFEWGENQASSYSWWLGFLNTLDGNNVELSKYPHLDRSTTMENSLAFGHQDSPKLEEEPPTSVDANDQNYSYPDEWLMFPSTDEQGETPNS